MKRIVTFFSVALFLFFAASLALPGFVEDASADDYKYCIQQSGSTFKFVESNTPIAIVSPSFSGKCKDDPTHCTRDSGNTYTCNFTMVTYCVSQADGTAAEQTGYTAPTGTLHTGECTKGEEYQFTLKEPYCDSAGTQLYYDTTADAAAISALLTTGGTAGQCAADTNTVAWCQRTADVIKTYEQRWGATQAAVDTLIAADVAAGLDSYSGTCRTVGDVLVLESAGKNQATPPKVVDKKLPTPRPRHKDSRHKDSRR